MRHHAGVGGLLYKRPPVGAGVGGDAYKRFFPEEVAVVVERRDVADVDPGENEGAAPLEGLQSDGHELAGWSEEDRRIEWHRRCGVSRAH